MAKYVVLYASHHPQMQGQTDIRSAHVHFYRPIFPANGPVTMKLDEVYLGRAWSTFRVELFQGNKAKIAAATDIW